MATPFLLERRARDRAARFARATRLRQFEALDLYKPPLNFPVEIGGV